MQYFLIFALKHRLWVLVRTASLRRFLRVPTINVLSKNKQNIRFFHLKIIVFTAVKYCCILHGRVCVMIACGKKRVNELVDVMSLFQDQTLHSFHMISLYCVKISHIIEKKRLNNRVLILFHSRYVYA